MTALDYQRIDPRAIVIGIVNNQDVTVQDVLGNAPFLDDPTHPDEEIVSYAKDLFSEYKRKHEIVAATALPEPTSIERMIMAQVTPAKVDSIERRINAVARVGKHLSDHRYEYIAAALTAASIVGGTYTYFSQ